MEGLDNKWILLQKEQDCDENDDNSPATLGLENMRGVFILVGVGIVGGLGLIVIEIIYKKHQMKKKNRSNMARVAIEKWRGTLQVSWFIFTRYCINYTTSVKKCQYVSSTVILPL